MKILIGAVLSLLALNVNAASYSITDLGSLGGGSSVARGLNDLGQVVGESVNSSGVQRAFLWSNGQMVELGAGRGVAYDINNSGQITGWVKYSATDPTTAFISNNGVLNPIGTLDGFSHSLGYRINEQGEVAGQAINSSGVSRAFLYDESGMNNLGPSGAGPNSSYGSSLNNNGQVVGWGANGALLFEGGTVSTLDTPWGPANRAHDITDAGAIVGSSSVDELSHATLWTGEQIVDLGTPDGYLRSGAQAINESGVVIGMADKNNPSERTTFLWEGGEMLDLSQLVEVQSAGWSALTEAYDINEVGQIVGMGIIGGENHAFLLTPVPIPPAVWLFSSGLSGLIGLARRKA